MHLIDALVSGFADAPGGSATIVRRGTTSPAVCYSDFEGTLPASTHTLDSRGRVSRYVNELVDVKVYDVNGTQVVDTFTAGSNATALEIVDAHTTGTDYSTGASGANKPTTLQTQLGARYTSFGAKDFKVLVGGAERNLKDVLLTGIIDVRGPTYAATGNGVTNETTIIQAAITAASTAGGGFVFFPPGTYIVDSLTIPINVTLLGCGSGKSVISSSYASDCILVGSGQFYAQGLKFITASYGLLRWTGAVGNGTVFTGCSFALTNAATKTIESDAGGGAINLATYMGCEFIQTGAGGAKPFLNGGASVHGGALTFVSGRAVGGEYINCHGVYFEYQGAVAGTFRTAASGTPQTFVGCTMAQSGIGACDVVGGTDLVELGCSVAFGTRTSVSRFNETREAAYTDVSGSATSYTPAPLSASKFHVTSSGASFQWNNPTVGSAFPGYDIELWYKNTSGGAITPTLDTIYKGTAVSVANNQACGWRFTWDTVSSKYVQLGSPVAYNA